MRKVDIGHPIPQVDLAACTFCGVCEQACHCGALRLAVGGPQFDPSRCHCEQHGREDMDCFGRCERMCPRHAITVEFEIVFE